MGRKAGGRQGEGEKWQHGGGEIPKWVAVVSAKA